MCEDHLQLPNIIWVGSGVHGEGSVRERVGTWRSWESSVQPHQLGSLGSKESAPRPSSPSVRPGSGSAALPWAVVWAWPPEPTGLTEPGYIRGETAPLPRP